MTEILFNTMDVAKMLQVDKSTVKRWTDEGKLKCFRTPGGHRKFRAEDLYQFMSDYNYGISPINLYPQFASDETIIRRIVAQKEYNVLANVCFSAAINGRRSEIVKLFSEVYRNGLSLPLLFDEILRPAVRRILVVNVSGKLSAADVQLSFSALSNAIVLLCDVVTKATANGKKAICATTEGDKRDIELKALALLLESEGFEVLNLGTSVSSETINQLVTSKRPHAVYIVSSYIPNQQTFIEEHKLILAAARSCGCRMIAAGSAYAAPGITNGVGVLYDKYCATFRECVAVQHDGSPAQGLGTDERVNFNQLGPRL